ncbi:MAG TPA: phospho-N-acetylmuramoyl-pentapeptide-transferase, partial [Caulobacteraceae bacterium]|nr:phospho-N-acetylmuramoyl-pentapeptide-transferase [Caulobacteraceae bacterium]
MLYLIYQHLAAGGHYVPILNLLKYLTVRAGLSLFTGQLVVAAMGNNFIAWMRAKQGKGQPIRTDGPERHILEKAGTPTMGGFMILAGLVIGVLLWGDLENPYVWTALVVTAGYGLLGFLDDYKKVTKQSAAGVKGSMKLVIQFIIALLAAWVLVTFTVAAKGEPPAFSTSLAFPLFKNLLLNLGWFYIAFGAVVIVGASNAVNLTDGLDGLAIGPVMIAAAAFSLIAYIVGNVKFADYLQLHYV